MSAQPLEIEIRVSIHQETGGNGTLALEERFPMRELDFEQISELMSQFHRVTEAVRQQAAVAEDRRCMVIDVQMYIRQGAHGDNISFGQRSPLLAKDFAQVAAIMANLHQFMEAIRAEYLQEAKA